MRLLEACRSPLAGIHRLMQRAGASLGTRGSGGVRTFELAYVILLSDAAHNYMSKLEIDLLKKYGPHEGLKAVPHITLKLGFHVPDIEPFERYFDELTSEVEPFQICIRNMGFFDEMGIVFMDVVPDPRLDRLRRRIVGDLSERYGIKPTPLEGDRYRFHATLAYLSRKDFERARTELESVRVEFRFMLETLALFCYTGNEWVTYKRAALSRFAGAARAV